jgi:hypothetical protein
MASLPGDMFDWHMQQQQQQQGDGGQRWRYEFDI